MLDKVKPEAVFVAVPTKFHYSMLKDLLKRKSMYLQKNHFVLT